MVVWLLSLLLSCRLVALGWYKLGARCVGTIRGSLIDMLIVKPGKLKHGLRMISAGIPSTLLESHKDDDVPTFWFLL